MEQNYFDIKNEQFYDFLEEMFNIKKSKSWDDIARGITLFKVKRTYRIFAELFPRKINYLSELSKLKANFSSIHYGSLKGGQIIDEVTKFSLYSDRIIVFHPLQNPAVTNVNMNPGKNPKYWLPDFLEALYFYIVIQKWVKLGIVKLIINPYAYDFELRESIDLKVKDRLKEVDHEELYKKSMPEVLSLVADSFTFSFRNKSKEEIYDYLISMEQPKFTHNNAKELSEIILNKIPSRNPLYDKLNISLDSGMISTIKGGGPLESILLIAETTGGSIYTPSDSNWAQIKKMGINDFWMKTNQLYSKIPLNFLNNVDTNFALELRRDNRLAGVRKQLKRIYSELNTVKIEELSDGKIRDLQDSFLEEIKIAEAEWLDIKKQAEINRKHWIASTFVGLPSVMTTNQVSILPLLGLSAAWLYKNERSKYEKEKLHRVKNPISVFVDLNNRRQNSFTIFKNCIF